MADILRAFIAIELSDEARGALAALEKTLSGSGADVKWVEAGNMHLTLEFLGNITTAQAGVVKETVSRISLKHPAFKIFISGIGAFPSLSHPKVIWAGITSGAPECLKIASELEYELRDSGIPKEDRTFKPHITIGRVRNERNIEKLKAMIEGGTITVDAAMEADSLTLFQSKLGPGGPVYAPLLKAMMAKA